MPSVQKLLSLSAPGEGAGGALRRGLGGMATALGVTAPPEEQAVVATAQPVLAGLCRRWAGLLLAALAEVNASLSEAAAGAPSLQGLPPQAGAGAADRLLLQWPTHWPHLLAPVLDWALDQWIALAQAQESEAAVAAARSSWEQVREGVLRGLPRGSNAALLLTAARQLAVPVRWVEADIMLAGQGRRSRLLRSTMTDATPSLGVMLARDKVRTGRLLRMAGVPVPRHFEVASLEAALAAARQLGWPVVVKPADRDGAEGARAGLRTEAHVAAAYRLASTVSKRILVEQHLPGYDHRLGVVHGRLFWAYGVRRASVVGDGVSSVLTLIDAENERRRRAVTGHTLDPKPIQLEPQDILFLEETDRPLGSVPAAGEEVLLQRVPDGPRGGLGHAALGIVHPDNRLLAERAARLLRLDIAGVDFITPDIGRSWREVGGAITEVNAIPQFYDKREPTLPRRLVRALVPGQGRIPLVYVLAAGEAPAWVEVLHARLLAAGLRVGLSTPAALRLGTDAIRVPRVSEWDDVQTLHMDPSAEAVVVVGNGAAFLRSGLPFDAVDALVVVAHAPQVLQLLIPYCGALRAVVGEDVARRYGSALQGEPGSWLVLPGGAQDEDRLVDEVARAILAAEAAYARAEPVLPDEIVGPSLPPLAPLNSRFAAD